MLFLRSQLGVPGAADTAVGSPRGVCDPEELGDLEELLGGPLVSAGREATGSGMADQGCASEGRGAVGKEAQRDPEAVQVDYQDGPNCKASPFFVSNGHR